VGSSTAEGAYRWGLGNTLCPRLEGVKAHMHVRDPLLTSLPKEALEALARSYD